METNRKVKCVLMMWITIVILILFNDRSACEEYHSVMNVEALNVKPLKHFWKSTGFCPPDPHDNVNSFLLSDDVKINLCIIGALPHRGIERVRVHWLLDLVKQRGSTLANLQYQYNFTQLDSFLDWLVGHRLNVGFELMGNPGNYFTNFADFAQVQQWETFVSILVQRYMERYSAETVSRWRFEVWNEPDHHDFDQLNFTKQTFNNYVKASLKGLRSTATHLQFGGPAENCSPPFNESKFCWSVLQLAEDFDFISIHKKGNEEVDSVWQNELEFYTLLIEKFPPYRQLDLYNDEADVLKNWSLEKEWRADTRYAAFVVSNVLLHVRNLINDRGIPFRSLSHDNGFLNFYPAFFTQRTLLARFQINNTNPRHTQFFKKPVYLAMGLLALLGDKQIHHSIRGHLPNSILHSLATMEADSNGRINRIAIIITHHNNTALGSATASMRLNIGMQLSVARYMTYQVNNIQTNPYGVWHLLGRPVFPHWKQRSLMRAHETPISHTMAHQFSTKDQPEIELSLPSVTLVNICTKPKSLPGKVSGVEIHNVTYGEVLILWDDAEVQSRCILTYEIEQRPADGMRFHRIVRPHSFFPSFHWAPKPRGKSEITRGLYRIRAVDYWLNRGPYSRAHYYGAKDKL